MHAALGCEVFGKGDRQQDLAGGVSVGERQLAWVSASEWHAGGQQGCSFLIHAQSRSVL
jgi:hypothetical protein